MSGHKWDPTMFRRRVVKDRVPAGYWRNVTNQRATMNAIAKKLSIANKGDKRNDRETKLLKN